MMKKVIIVIPAYNEEEILGKNIIKLHNFCKKNIRKYNWEIIISDNNSQDKTLEIAKKLAKKYKQIGFVHQTDRPKSLSLKNTFLKFDSDFYMYMDADLSTDLKHIPELLQEIEQGYDIVIGSRIVKKRTLKRSIISYWFNLILKIFLLMNIKDFQCGFKIINKKTRDNIIPKMKALRHGFMDTEMIVVAHKKRYKIKEIPVSWEDERESKEQLFKATIDVFKNLARIKLDLLLGKY